MPGDDELDAGSAQRFDDIEILFPGYPENPLDTLVLQSATSRSEPFIVCTPVAGGRYADSCAFEIRDLFTRFWDSSPASKLPPYLWPLREASHPEKYQFARELTTSGSLGRSERRDRVKALVRLIGGGTCIPLIVDGFDDPQVTLGPFPRTASAAWYSGLSCAAIAWARLSNSTTTVRSLTPCSYALAGIPRARKRPPAARTAGTASLVYSRVLRRRRLIGSRPPNMPWPWFPQSPVIWQYSRAEFLGSIYLRLVCDEVCSRWRA